MKDERIEALIQLAKDASFTELQRALEKLKEDTARKEERAPVEFNCPCCKHITLAEQCRLYPNCFSYSSFLTGERYCYTCGKKFQKETSLKWTEVK